MPATPLINTLVTLYVNTAGDLNNDLENNVWFADTDGDVANNNGANVSNYLTEVTKNGNITWVGAVKDITANPTDYVTITGITPLGDLRNKLSISAEPSNPANGNVTHVNARVTGNASTDPLEYSITFVVSKINNLGERHWNTFTIDPKLRISTTQ
ncbi:MAG: hypothetical protein HKO92_07715 [Flavobacteriaceae bacterium]|nr:hypothetical protein [Bacteroidia bacterium]NNK82995.1 hypothetical protein [Flavobacteriaceae bacterium]